ncbi:MAG: hypothetical protein ACSLFN_13235 [Candidatus Limnocylindrales bacterium]
MNDLRVGRRFGAGILSIAFAVTACGSAAAPTASPTLPPDAPVTSPPDGGSGAPIDPGLGGAKPVVPKPGQLDVRAVQADTLTATVNGSTITVTATWTSGVEPCNVLDQILVDRVQGTYSITLREGHGPEEIACIAIAEQHVTTFEIKDVASGTYTIRDATGGAADIQVTVG